MFPCLLKHSSKKSFLEKKFGCGKKGVPLAEQVTHAESRAAFLMIGQAMTTQVNYEVVASINPRMNSNAARVLYFIKIDHSEFHGSKVDEDIQEFIEAVFMTQFKNNKSFYSSSYLFIDGKCM